MSTIEVSVPILNSERNRIYGPHLTGVWRITGISVWAVICLISLGVFILSTHYWFVCDTMPAAIAKLCRPDIPPERYAWYRDYQDSIRQLGMSLLSYATILTVLRSFAFFPYLLLSTLIIQHRSDRLMAVLFAIFLVVFGAAGRSILPNWYLLPYYYPWTYFPINLLGFILASSIVLLYYTFPDGRFVPHWTFWLALIVLLLKFNEFFLTNLPINMYLYLPDWTGSLVDLVLAFIGLYAMIYRYHHYADGDQKQQIKWLIVSVVLLTFFYSAHIVLYRFKLLMLSGWIWALSGEGSLTFRLVLEPGWYVGQVLMVVGICIALFRYRLWEIDLIINRVLVYGSLTLLTMGFYAGAVTGLGSILRGLTSPIVFFLVTGFIAIIFEPLHSRLQRLVNRLMYGERDEPYSVLTRLANTLEHSATPGDMLPSIARIVSQTLKIPYVAILIHENVGDRLVAVAGQPVEELQSFPLVYQTEIIGELQVGLRARGEEFSTADCRLLENIARQAGSAAETIRLNAELSQSRAEIVTTREEERRRLRRDLHDGLGPILASQTLKMAAVRQLVRQNPERAETMLDDIIQQNEGTVSEVRRLVYGLRPPALDELGLVQAVRELVQRSEPGNNSITVEGPEEGLPKLPAAVEANAYRIALEGLTNATRHSKAQHYIIRFAIENLQHNGEAKRALVVQISDDGTGMPKQYRAGVGIRSMRERAEELGGQLLITPGNPHGTQVNAWLPLVEKT